MTTSTVNKSNHSNETIEQMLSDVLGDRQVAYIDDLEKIFGRHRQSIWRWYKAGLISEPAHFGQSRVWPRPIVKKDLNEMLANTNTTNSSTA